MAAQNAPKIYNYNTMPNNIKFLFAFILLLFFIITLTSPALAALKFENAQSNITTTASQAGLQTTDIPTIAAIIITALLGLVGMIFFILFIYGGFQWMTAAGNEEKIRKAKKLIVNAVIGLAIIIMAYAITYFISQAIEAPAEETQTTPTPTP